jgi:hypothetical protein
VGRPSSQIVVFSKLLTHSALAQVLQPNCEHDHQYYCLLLVARSFCSVNASAAEQPVTGCGRPVSQSYWPPPSPADAHVIAATCGVWVSTSSTTCRSCPCLAPSDVLAIPAIVDWHKLSIQHLTPKSSESHQPLAIQAIPTILTSLQSNRAKAKKEMAKLNLPPTQHSFKFARHSSA